MIDVLLIIYGAAGLVWMWPHRLFGERHRPRLLRLLPAPEKPVQAWPYVEMLSRGSVPLPAPSLQRELEIGCWKREQTPARPFIRAPEPWPRAQRPSLTVAELGEKLQVIKMPIPGDGTRS